MTRKGTVPLGTGLLTRSGFISNFVTLATIRQAQPLDFARDSGELAEPGGEQSRTKAGVQSLDSLPDRQAGGFSRLWTGPRQQRWRRNDEILRKGIVSLATEIASARAGRGTRNDVPKETAKEAVIARIPPTAGDEAIYKNEIVRNDEAVHEVARTYETVSSRGMMLIPILFLVFWTSNLGAAYGADESSAADQMRGLIQENRDLRDANKAYENKMLGYVTQLTVKEKELAELGKKLGNTMSQIASLKTLQAEQEKALVQMKEIQLQAETQGADFETLKAEAEALAEEAETLRKSRDEALASQEMMKQKDTARAADQEKLRGEMESLKNQMERLQEERTALAAALETAQKNAESWTADLQKRESEREAAAAEKAEAQKKIQALSAELEASQKNHAEAKASLDAAHKKEASLAAERDTLESTRKTLAVEKAVLETRIKALTGELEDLRTENTQAAEFLEKVKEAGGDQAEELKKLEEENLALRDDVEFLSMENLEVSEALETLRKRESDWTAQREKQESEQKTLMQDKEALETRQKDLGAEIETLRKEKTELTAQLKAVEKGGESLSAERLRMEDAKKALEEEKTAWKKKMETLNTEIETLRKEKAVLASSLEAAQKMESDKAGAEQKAKDEISRLQKEKDAAEKKLKAVSGELEALRKERDLQAKSGEAVKKGEALWAQEKKALEEALQKLENEKAKTEARVKALLAELDAVRQNSKSASTAPVFKEAAAPESLEKNKDAGAPSPEDPDLQEAAEILRRIQANLSGPGTEPLPPKEDSLSQGKSDQDVSEIASPPKFMADRNDVPKETAKESVIASPSTQLGMVVSLPNQSPSRGDAAISVLSSEIASSRSGRGTRNDAASADGGEAPYTTLEKSVKRPVQERLAAWQDPGFIEEEESSAETETDFSDRTGDARIQAELLKDAEYYSGLLQAKAASLEAEGAKKDQELEKLRADLADTMSQGRRDRRTLQKALQAEMEKAEDLEIRAKAGGGPAQQAGLRPEVRSSAAERQARPDPGLEKKIQGLRADARKDRQDYYYNLGVILMREGRFKKAAALFEKALHLDPLDTSAHYNLGILYDDHLNQPKKAIRHYEAFIQLSRNRDQVRDVAKWLKLNQDYYGSGGRQSRVQSMRQAVEELIFTSP